MQAPRNVAFEHIVLARGHPLLDFVSLLQLEIFAGWSVDSHTVKHFIALMLEQIMVWTLNRSLHDLVESLRLRAVDLIKLHY